MALVEKFAAHCLSGRWLITWTKTGHQGLEKEMFNDAEWQATPIQEFSNLVIQVTYSSCWSLHLIQELSNQVIQVIFGSCWSPHHTTVEVSLTLLGWWWIRTELESSWRLGLLNWRGLGLELGHTPCPAEVHWLWMAVTHWIWAACHSSRGVSSSS